jgi:hypothetical protein
MSSGSPPSTIVATAASRRRASAVMDVGQYTSLSQSPAVKKLAFASSLPHPVTVTLVGDGGSPRATRCARRSPERTSSRGLSFRTVAAPTSIASHDARTASTRSKSASFESGSRLTVALSRYPSMDMPQLSRVYGRSATL